MGSGNVKRSLKMEFEYFNDHIQFPKMNTVSASMQPRGSIFPNWFLGEVLFKFDAHGVVFEMGFYYSSVFRLTRDHVISPL